MESYDLSGHALKKLHLAQAAAALPGPNYHEVLRWIHAGLKPATYVEIGVHDGASLSLASPSTTCIGIDPEPLTPLGQLTAPTRVFQETSDEFFQKRDLAALLGGPFSLAFIDGLHLFEQALRDFIHLEPFAAPDSVILIHDCIPLNDVTSMREQTTGFHSGDTWKLAICLAQYRPDLRLVLVPTAPTGLCMVAGLDPESTVLQDRYAEIVDRFVPLTYAFYHSNPVVTPTTISNHPRSVLSWLGCWGQSPENDLPSGSSGPESPLVRSQTPTSGERSPRMLGVLLCYNDGDLLSESIEYLLEQEHDLIVWDHGSTDETPAVIDRYRSELREVTRLPRNLDFYELYPAMSLHLLEHYVGEYDWISWPDQDEFLEGPTRERSYREWVAEVLDSRADWVTFDDFTYWFTDEDDERVEPTTARLRYYSHNVLQPRKFRAWRASATNIRVFNHNRPLGAGWLKRFRLRHYPARSIDQIAARVDRDRAGLRRGLSNYHYEQMRMRPERMRVSASRLHYDHGVSDLNPQPVYDWRLVFGHPPERPATVDALKEYSPGLIVLGMSPSGTSMISRLVDLLGVPVSGDAQRGARATSSNIRRHWESEEMRAVNDSLLLRFGGDSYSPPSLPSGWQHEEDLDDLRAHAGATFSSVFEPGQWCWTDPRNCLTLPFWREVLPRPQVAVLVWRHPVEVAAALSARDGLPVNVGLALWERYCRCMLNAAEGLPALVVNCDELARDPSRWCGEAVGFLSRYGFRVELPGDADIVGPVGIDLPHAVAPADSTNDLELSAAQSQLIECLEAMAGTHEALPCAELVQETSWCEPLLAERRSTVVRWNISMMQFRTRVLEADERRLAKVTNGLDRLRARRDRVEVKARSLAAALRRTRNEVGRLEDRLAALMSSRSYRYAAPFRVAFRYARNLRRR